MSSIFDLVKKVIKMKKGVKELEKAIEGLDNMHEDIDNMTTEELIEFKKQIDETIKELKSK